MDSHAARNAVSLRERYLPLLHLFSSAVTSQALLSAASFAIGLILIRRTSDLQYGYYVLASSPLILLISLQYAFFNPPLVVRLTRLDAAGRGALVGGMLRSQRLMLSLACVLALLLALALWAQGLLDAITGPLMIAAVLASFAILNREYFRMVLLAHRRPQDVLRTDVLYITLMVSGVFLATLTPAPAASAVLALGLAAVVSGWLLSRALRRHESWDMRGVPGILREIAPLAAWSTAGAAIHWCFSQGYAFLAAGTLSVTAVAAIAATRLLLMPVNLLSAGIGGLIFPLAAGWLHRHDAQLVLRRLALFSAGLVGAGLCYFAVLWLARDWVFASILKKDFAQRDALLLLWAGAFAVTSVRDQMIYFLVLRGRFRALTTMTACSAVFSLAIGYWGLLRFGVIGAPLGVLLGEMINVAGILLFSRRELARPIPVPV